MAIPVASLPFIPSAPPDVQPAASPTTAPGESGPFQTALDAARTPPAETGATADADLAAELAPIELELDTEFDATLTPESSLIGLLAFVTQTLAPPENAAVAQATGLTTEPTALTVPADATPQPPGPPTDARTRADQLRLDRGPTTAAAVPGETPPAEPAPTATTTARASTFFTNDPNADTTGAEVATADQANSPAAAARAAATAGTRSGSSIPAQVPIVTNLIPVVPTPANLSVESPPVAEPSAAVAASALPSAGLGERPATAGEQFVADAVAGARLAAPGPGSVVFANTLAVEVAEPQPAVNPTAVVRADSKSAAEPLLPLAVAPVPAEATAGESESAATFGRAVADIARSVARANAAVPEDFVTRLAVATEPLAAQPIPPPHEEPAQPGAATAAHAAAVASSSLPAPPVAPAAVSETTAVRVPPAAQIADTIVTHARVLERDGAVEFQMRLDPPELGRMQIRLVTRGDEVHGHVLVANEAVRSLIESQLPELRQRLEAAGVSVQRFDVSADPNAGGGRSPYRDADREFAPRATTTASAPRARIGRPGSGSLDVTV